MKAQERENVGGNTKYKKIYVHADIFKAFVCSRKLFIGVLYEYFNKKMLRATESYFTPNGLGAKMLLHVPGIY